jgi:glutamate racemase
MHPIGVFDSGVGGLSVLRALHAELPCERFVYLADSGHAPYGERDEAHILQRSQAIARYLTEQHAIKALVVACNTATAAAIAALRKLYPALPIIGIEPALKPAAMLSQTHKIGVMATRGTLASDKFHNLLHLYRSQAEFVLQPCDGLADAIERDDAVRIRQLCQHYTQEMGSFGHQEGQIDTLVLGCTHYPFVQTTLEELTAAPIRFLEGGLPVARHTKNILTEYNQCQADGTAMEPENKFLFISTGDSRSLNQSLQRWLHMAAPIHSLTHI